MLHKLTSWEDNGYHDSYFYVSVWDDEARTVRAIETGSTAYSGGNSECSYPPISDVNALRDAITWLADYIYNVIRPQEHADVLEPQAAELRADYRLTRAVKHKGEKYESGLVGRAFWSGAYGQFYRNGYNRPNRANTRVGLELTDGRKVFVALSALRCNREPLSDTELRSRAWNLAQNCQFSRATKEKHAWDSANYALSLYQRTIAREMETIAA